MTVSIIDVLRQYLHRDLTLDEFRDWLAVYQWDLQKSDQRIADEVDVVLVHMDDGYTDEYELRNHLASILEINTTTTISYDISLRASLSFRTSAVIASSAGTTSSNRKRTIRLVLV